MVLPIIKVRVRSDTKGAPEGINRVSQGLDRLSSSSDRARVSTQRLSRRLSNDTSRYRNLGLGVQNAAFQFSDYAVQVGGGVAPSRALAQQLPQLLQGFGILGAVLGATVAIAIPLGEAMNGLRNDSASLENALGTLQPVADAIGSSFERMRELAIGGAEILLNNVDRVLVIAGTAAAFFAGRWVASFAAARAATLSLAASLATLRTAIARTGIGLLIVGAGEAVFQFTRLTQAAGGFGNMLGVLGEIAAEVWEKIKRGSTLLEDVLVGVALVVEGAFLKAFSRIAAAFARLTQTIAGGINGLLGSELSGLSDNFGSSLGADGDQLVDSGTNLLDSVGNSIGEIADEPLKSVAKLRESLQSMKDDQLTIPDILGVGEGDVEGSGGGGGGGSALKERLEGQAKIIADHMANIRGLTEGGLRNQLGAWDNYFANLVSLTGSNSKRLLGIAKSFGAAQALIDAYKAHNLVLSDPKLPWFARIASAATVLASGLGAVNAIRSVTEGGNGAVGGGGAATTSASAAATEQASQSLAVTINPIANDALFSGSQLNAFIDHLSETLEGRGINVLRAV